MFMATDIAPSARACCLTLTTESNPNLQPATRILCVVAVGTHIYKVLYLYCTVPEISSTPALQSLFLEAPGGQEIHDSGRSEALPPESPVVRFDQQKETHPCARNRGTEIAYVVRTGWKALH